MNPLANRPARSLLAVAVAVAATVAAPSWAGEPPPPNPIVVTTASDAVDAFDQACSLREALANANTNTASSPVVDECPAGSGSATDQILLQSGTTYLLSLDDAAEGDLDIVDDPSLAAGIRDVTIGITGGVLPATITQQVAGERVLHIAGAWVSIDKLTIRGGSTADVGGGIYNNLGALALSDVELYDNEAVSGAGLYSDGDATLVDSAVTFNTAGLIGGGILQDGGSLLLENTLVRGNAASSGGGMYLIDSTAVVQAGSEVQDNNSSGDGAGILSTGQNALTMADTLVTGNVAQGSGGGVYSASSVEVLFEDTDFADNEAGMHGGAIRALESDVSVDGGLFSSNTAVTAGGALYVARADVNRATFDGNSTDGDGGAVWASISCTVSESTLVDNVAQDGGGMHCQIANLARVTLQDNTALGLGGGAYVWNEAQILESKFVSNMAVLDGGALWIQPAVDASIINRSLFQSNMALGDGGGVWVGPDDFSVVFGNSTLSGNIANGSGSGLYVEEGAIVFGYNSTFAMNGPSENIAKYGNLTLQNSIITSPGSTDCVALLENPSIISLGGNLSDDDSCIGLDQAGDQTEVDVMLAALANNGGGTRTHALMEGSPAIDAAIQQGCNGKLTAGVDQRGAPRPALACDIGAHEQDVVLVAIFADGFED